MEIEGADWKYALLSQQLRKPNEKRVLVDENRSGFYIDAMPVVGSNGPSFIFHCSFDSPDVKELVFCIINLKKDADAFRVGEIFPSDQLNAILKPRKETEDYFYNSTQGSIKLADKKKADGRDILTFELDELAFEGGYTINGRVDFEYGGTVY